MVLTKKCSIRNFTAIHSLGISIKSLSNALKLQMKANYCSLKETETSNKKEFTYKDKPGQNI